MKKKLESAKPDAQEQDPLRNGVKEFLRTLATLKEGVEAGPLAAIIGDLPKQLQREILTSSERLRSEMAEQGMPADQIDRVVAREAKERTGEIMAAYTDKRFNSINGSYFRLELMRTIEELATDEPDLEKVTGTAIISFDVNGLKAVNDLNDSHEQGDNYLRAVYDVLHNGQTSAELRQRQLEVEVASNGGDEFAIILKGSEALISEAQQTEIMEAIVKKYQQEIGSLTHYKDEKTGERTPFIDFKDNQVKQKFEAANIAIPDDFEFHASISAGAANLMEAIISYVEQAELGAGEIAPKYNQILGGVMGQAFGISDERSGQDKEKFKEGLKNSSDEHENFLGLVLARNKEVMELTVQNKELRAALDMCEANLSKYRQ